MRFRPISSVVTTSLALAIAAVCTAATLAKDSERNGPSDQPNILGKDQAQNQAKDPRKDQRADRNPESKAGTPSTGCTLIFPKDRNYGNIYTVPKETSLCGAHPKLQLYSPARGVVRLKADSRVVFLANALVAEKPELLALPPSCVVGLILTRLDLSDQAFSNTSKLANLEYLSIDGTEISDQSLKTIGGFRKLRFLDISATQINGSGFGYLKTLPQLSILRASSNRTKHWQGLADLASVGSLELSKSGVDDAALVPIGKMRGLIALDIPFSKATDAGLKALASAKQLERLDIRNSPITAAGLLNLGKGPLKTVKVSKMIKDKDKALLAKQFPGLRIAADEDFVRENASEIFAPLH